MGAMPMMRSQPNLAARSRLVDEGTPPSTSVYFPAFTGGYKPGVAQAARPARGGAGRQRGLGERHLRRALAPEDDAAPAVDVDRAQVESLVRPLAGELLGQPTLTLGHGEQPAREAPADDTGDGERGPAHDGLPEHIRRPHGDAAELDRGPPA